MRKKVLIVIVAVVCVLIVGKVGYDLIYGNAFYGEGWQKTPVEALAKEAKNGNPNEADVKTAVSILDTVYSDGNAFLLYVSKANSLVLGTFAQNKDGTKWHLSGWSEETDLNDPYCFILDGTQDQEILFPYRVDQEKRIIFGWKRTDTPTVQVNGVSTNKKTILFEMGNVKGSIDYWWVELAEIPATISLSYLSE